MTYRGEVGNGNLPCEQQTVTKQGEGLSLYFNLLQRRSSICTINLLLHLVPTSVETKRVLSGAPSLPGRPAAGGLPSRDAFPWIRSLFGALHLSYTTSHISRNTLNF